MRLDGQRSPSVKSAYTPVSLLILKERISMGFSNYVDAVKYPKQGRMLNKKVEVCFNFDIHNIFYGKVIRYDIEEPFEVIIRLNDGRIIMSGECQFREREGFLKWLSYLKLNRKS
jgi:hypothetical protein